MNKSEKPIWKLITPADVVLVCLLLGIGVGSPLLFKGGAEPFSKTAVIRVDGVLWQRVPLDKAQKLTVPGTEGPVEVEMGGGGIRVTRSSCPHKYCIAAGTISRIGSFLVCVPNKVLITIEGQAEDGTADGISE